MARFAVEVRASRGVSKYKPVKGYLGEMVNAGPDDDGPRYGVRGVETMKDTSYIPFFESKRDARRAVAEMPDAFFDVYETEIVEIDPATESDLLLSKDPPRYFYCAAGCGFILYDRLLDGRSIQYTNTMSAMLAYLKEKGIGRDVEYRRSGIVVIR